MPGTIADTTVLSNFAHVRQPSLLRQLFPSLGSPVSVFGELSRGVRSGLVPKCDWTWLEIIPLTAAENAHAAELLSVLERGEADCLAIAKARDWVVLTDDRDARKAAALLGLEISGTLGCLDLLVQEGLLELNAADALLSEMIACGYRSPVRSLRKLSNT